MGKAKRSRPDATAARAAKLGKPGDTPSVDPAAGPVQNDPPPSGPAPAQAASAAAPPATALEKPSDPKPPATEKPKPAAVDKAREVDAKKARAFMKDFISDLPHEAHLGLYSFGVRDRWHSSKPGLLDGWYRYEDWAVNIKGGMPFTAVRSDNALSPKNVKLDLT